MITLHGAAAADWQAAEHEPTFVPAAFEHDGFIHTSVGAETLARALNRHLRDDPRPYVALVIDLDRVAARWEIAQYPGDPALYPHIFAPLPRAAVITVMPIPRADDGAFLLPDFITS